MAGLEVVDDPVDVGADTAEQVDEQPASGPSGESASGPAGEMDTSHETSESQQEDRPAGA